MLVETIETVAELELLRQHWDRVYAADPYARYFIAYPFIRDWLASMDGGWFVLVARPAKDQKPVGFLPLRLRTRARPDGRCVSEVLMAGNYGADYTGLLITPGYSNSAVAAFAKALESMAWTMLNFDYVAAEDPRYRALTALFPRNNFRLAQEERVNQRDKVNNLVCPMIALPENWDIYLSGLSANMRQKLRRLLRQFDEEAELEICFPTARTLPQDFDALATLWLDKWKERKGEERAHSIIATNRQMTLRAFLAGNLHMPILKHRGVPVAGLVSFLDYQKKRAHFFMTGRDESFVGPSPGLLLHAYSIRQLIAEGFGVYDFMRGDEPYKLLFTTQAARLQCLRVGTRNGHNPQDRLEPMALPAALALATAAHSRGRFRQAATGYGQILANDDTNSDALYRYAQLLEQINRPKSAAQLYRRLLALQPDNKAAKQRLLICHAAIEKAQQAKLH